MELRVSACSLAASAALLVSKANRMAVRIIRHAFLLALAVGLPSSVAAQTTPGTTPSGAEAQKCAALSNFNLEQVPGGPALITSARVVAVPPNGLERWILAPSGFGSAGRIREYCDVTGYVAPQNYTGRNTYAAAWFAQAFSDGQGGSVLNADAAETVHKSVLDHCGAQDGVEEGLVIDPPSCKWQPEMIACAAGRDGADCLSRRQVAAVKRLMTPVTNSKGQVLYAYPYIPGTETMWAGWNYFGSPRPGITPRLANLELPGQYGKYLLDEKIRENEDALAFDFDRDPASFTRARAIYDATSFDLREFKARGGKLLIWHGWADGAIMATSSIGYYQGVLKFMGGRKQIEDFVRLFLVPGVHHSGGGPGFTEFDSMSALENWVEKGQVPDKLIACQSSEGNARRCRPIFPYPVLARYSGKGDPKQAESFVAFDPTGH